MPCSAQHEGVMVKALDAPYEPGSRSAAWLKVKRAHTLDLVVLAAEWGHGRRRGWLSNLHLGARDPTTGEFVMLGKTFKGMTDALLEWQTKELLSASRAIATTGSSTCARSSSSRSRSTTCRRARVIRAGSRCGSRASRVIVRTNVRRMRTRWIRCEPFMPRRAVDPRIATTRIAKNRGEGERDDGKTALRGTEHAEAQAVAARIIAERGGLLHLYRMLLNSVPLAEGWLTFLTAIRQRLSLSGTLRELVIMRVAILNGAQYEADQHAPIALREGLTQRQLEALADWQDSDAFTAAQRAALALTDAMTRDVQVADETFDQVRGHLSDREVVELVATIAAYNMVSRFIEALGIHSDEEIGRT